jgi:hypothetical protein
MAPPATTPTRRPARTSRTIQQALAQLGAVVPGNTQQLGAGQLGLPPGADPRVMAGYIGNTQPALAAGQPLATATSAPLQQLAQSTPLQAAAGQAQFGPSMAPAPTSVPGPTPPPATPGNSVASAASQVARSAGPVTATPSPSMGMAAPAGRFASMARTPFMGTTPYATTGALGGRLAAGSIGRASLIGLGGQIAGRVWDRAVGERDGTWDDAVGSALRLGGAGAGIGSLFGPVGTAVGGLGGVAFGTAKGLITGDDSAPTELNRYLFGSKDAGGTGGAKGELTALMGEYGISQDTQQQLIMQLDLIPQMGLDKAGAEQLIGQLVQQIPQFAAEDQMRQQATARSAAIQAAIAPMMQQQLDMFNQSATQAASAMTSASQSTGDPALRDAYAAAAANYLTTSRQAGLGYLQQIAVAPEVVGGQSTQTYDQAYNTALARAQAQADVQSGSAANASLFAA